MASVPPTATTRHNARHDRRVPHTPSHTGIVRTPARSSASRSRRSKKQTLHRTSAKRAVPVAITRDAAGVHVVVVQAHSAGTATAATASEAETKNGLTPGSSRSRRPWMGTP